MLYARTSANRAVYLALGTSTPERQLIAALGRSLGFAAFSPAADAQLAGQSLPTACSTIRRSIGECVGRANVSRTGVLELILENAVISSCNFVAEYN